MLLCFIYFDDAEIKDTTTTTLLLKFLSFLSNLLSIRPTYSRFTANGQNDRWPNNEDLWRWLYIRADKMLCFFVFS